MVWPSRPLAPSSRPTHNSAARKEHYKYDPDEGARRLLQEAGYGPDKPVKAKVMISTSGSGQMLPLPMNEFLQQNLKECGFDISFEVVEWGTMLVALAQRADGAAGAGLGRHEHQPAALDGHLADRPLLPVQQRGAKGPQLGELEERGVRQADRPDREGHRQGARSSRTRSAPMRLSSTRRPGRFIVHDRNPRAMTKKVKGFVSAQSWFQDFTERGDGVILRSALRLTARSPPAASEPPRGWCVPSREFWSDVGLYTPPPALRRAGAARRVDAGLRALIHLAPGDVVDILVPPEVPKEIADGLRRRFRPR